MRRVLFALRGEVDGSAVGVLVVFSVLLLADPFQLLPGDEGASGDVQRLSPSHSRHLSAGNSTLQTSPGNSTLQTSPGNSTLQTSPPPPPNPCTRGATWCTHSGTTYDGSTDCDGDGVADPWCRDSGGSVGVIQSSRACADSWPNGVCNVPPPPPPPPPDDKPYKGVPAHTRPQTSKTVTRYEGNGCPDNASSVSTYDEHPAEPHGDCWEYSWNGRNQSFYGDYCDMHSGDVPILRGRLYFKRRDCRGPYITYDHPADGRCIDIGRSSRRFQCGAGSPIILIAAGGGGVGFIILIIIIIKFVCCKKKTSSGAAASTASSSSTRKVTEEEQQKKAAAAKPVVKGVAVPDQADDNAWC